MALCSPAVIKDLVLNTETPLVLKDFRPNWEIFNGTLEDWCENFDKSPKCQLNFERMDLENGSTPQWERRRMLLQLKATDFFKDHSSENKSYWTSLNYKRDSELPPECTKDIDFGCFGFSSRNRDYSFWLGSKGSNTPCHYDTYGCNIVTQIFGKKSWLLFPPNAPLKACRIPYEESSVYCSENFFSPDPNKMNQFDKIKSFAFHCVLNPGDVLIVPPQWWHYVESVENSLSVNHWVPLSSDIDKQMEECITKFLVETLLEDSTFMEHEYILNPNQWPLEMDGNRPFDILKHLLEIKRSGKIMEENHSHGYMDKTEFENLLKSVPKAKTLEPLTTSKFEELLLNNSKRYNSARNETDIPISGIYEALFNSILHPNVIENIKTEFLQRTSQSR